MPLFADSRILHTMLRVANLERSIEFYTRVLGMKLLRRRDYPDGRFTLVFIGYRGEHESAVLELTHNWGIDDYEPGTAFGHIAISVDDIASVCASLKITGTRIIRPAGPMKHDANEIIAFIEDPDGYRIELIEKPSCSAA